MANRYYIYGCKTLLSDLREIVDSAAQFEEEGKTPVIALCEKNRPGFWVMVHSSDLEKLKK